MKLRQANCESDWNLANEILGAVVRRLDTIGKSLWTESQISVEGLKNSYCFAALHFLVEEDQTIGVVFLQTSDPEFWPELSDCNSLFFHKLAVHPQYRGTSKGKAAVACIIDYAKTNGFAWVRMDCDDREELLSFYESVGFSCVSTEQIDGFNVVKHQLSTHVSTRPPVAADELK